MSKNKAIAGSHDLPFVAQPLTPTGLSPPFHCFSLVSTAFDCFDRFSLFFTIFCSSLRLFIQLLLHISDQFFFS